MEEATCYTLLTLFTLFLLFILFKLLYTASTVACMPIYTGCFFTLLGKVRALLEQKVSKKWECRDWSGWSG